MTSENVEPSRPRVAVVYHYFAHYREPILRVLSQQTSPSPEYVLISDRESNLPALDCIDPELAERPVDEGGLHWRFIRNRWITRDVLWQRGLLRIAVSNEFDTIIYLGTVYFLSTWVAAALSRLTGKRVLMWSHGLTQEETGVKRWVRKLFYLLANDLLLYGHRAKRLLIDLGFDSDRLHVIYNSLDYEKQSEIDLRLPASTKNRIRHELFGHDDSPVLLYIGRVTLEKQLELILQAAVLLEDEMQLNVNIIIIGEGPAIGALREKAVSLGLSKRVRFIGACYDETRIAEFFRAADLCLVPGPVGLTAIHSLTYGTPVITNDDLDSQKPEVEAIVEGETGSFFRKGDARALAVATAEWLERTEREGDDVASRCRAIIETRYNPHVQGELINAVIEELPPVEAV